MTSEQCEKKVREIIQKAIDEKLSPFLSVYPRDVVIAIYQIGLHAGLDCGRYVEYKNKKEDKV